MLFNYTLPRLQYKMKTRDVSGLRMRANGWSVGSVIKLLKRARTYSGDKGRLKLNVLP